MRENEDILELRSVLMPAFYRNFHCLADRCVDSCCRNWAVTFSKKDYFRLRRAECSDKLKEKIRRSVRHVSLQKNMEDRGMYARIIMEEDGGCPMLTEQGLCSLQLELGEEMLPEVCRTFPRSTTLAATKSQFMTLGCEGVLEELWARPEGLDFIEEPLEEPIYAAIGKETLLRWSLEVQSACIDILQCRTLSMEKRMLFLGLVLQKLQEMDWNRPNVPEWCGLVDAMLHMPQLEGVLSGFSGNRSQFLAKAVGGLLRMTMSPSDRKPALELLEALDCDCVEEHQAVTFHPDLEKVGRAYDEGLAAVKNSLGDLSYFLENLMVVRIFGETAGMLSGKENLMQGYAELCCLFGLLKTAIAAVCRKDASRAAVNHAAVGICRCILHGNTLQVTMLQSILEDEKNMLTQLAILLDPE